MLTTDDIKSAMKEINKLDNVHDWVVSASGATEVPLDLAPPMTPAVSPPRMEEGDALVVYEDVTEPQLLDGDGFVRPQAPISQPQLTQVQESPF